MAVRSAFVAGYEAASCLANTSAAAVVCARSTPGFIRPKTSRWPPPRPCSTSVEPGWITACMPMGTHISGQKPNMRSPRNPRGATPVTVNSVPLSRTTRPAMSRVGPKAPAPALVAQHHERIGSLGRVGGLEEAARGGRHAEHGEVVLGHHLAPHHVARHGPRRTGDGDVERHARHRRPGPRTRRCARDSRDSPRSRARRSCRSACPAGTGRRAGPGPAPGSGGRGGRSRSRRPCRSRRCPRRG